MKSFNLWTSKALTGTIIESHINRCGEDSAVLTRLTDVSRPTVDTAISNNCCSTTQTQGPGCCQFRAENALQMPVGFSFNTRRELENTRLWPIPLQ